MPKKSSGPAHERRMRQQRAQRDFERQVLVRLKQRQDKLPLNWEGLYVLFDLRRTGEIGNVLNELKQWGHIAVDKDQNVTITERGLKRLEDRSY